MAVAVVFVGSYDNLRTRLLLRDQLMQPTIAFHLAVVMAFESALEFCLQICYCDAFSRWDCVIHLVNCWI